MSEDSGLDTPAFRRHPVVDPNDEPETPASRTSIIGIAAFAIAGLAVAAALLGKDEPQASMAAYFVHGQIITEGRHSLDLSRPIFVRPQVPVCPTEDALASYSPEDPQGCAVLHGSASAGVVGIVTNGMRQPTFQMQMKTSTGTIEGWVGYNNLTN